jgi:hypothetical protein
VSKWSNRIPQRNLRPASRPTAAVLSTTAPISSAFRLSDTSTDADVEIAKWLKLVESYLQQVPRRSKA